MQESEGINTRQIYWGANGPLEPIILLIFAVLAAPHSQQLLFGCSVPSAKCSWLARDQYIWHRSCWSRESAANASFSPLSGLSSPTWLSISPRREACLPLAYHRLASCHPLGMSFAYLTQKVGMWAGWRDGEGWTRSFMMWWGRGHADEQPLVCFHQGITLPILLHKSHIFCSNPYAWSLLAYWCNTHSAPWWHWAQIIGWGG